MAPRLAPGQENAAGKARALAAELAAAAGAGPALDTWTGAAFLAVRDGMTLTVIITPGENLIREP